MKHLFDIAEIYLNQIRNENTRRAYRRCLIKCFGWIHSEIGYTPTKLDWTFENISDWIETDTDIWSPATKAQAIAIVKAFDKWVSDYALIPPATRRIETLKITRKAADRVTPNGLFLFQQKFEHAKTYRETRNAFLPLFLVNTGLRISEALTLGAHQVNTQKQLIQNIKTKGCQYFDKILTSPFTRQLEKFLLKRNRALSTHFWDLGLADPDPAKFPLWLSFAHSNTDTPRSFKWSTTSASRAISEMAKQLGLGRTHPHMFRHTFAMRLLESTGDLRLVQQELNHSSIASTTRYTERTLDQRRAILEKAYGTTV